MQKKNLRILLGVCSLCLLLAFFAVIEGKGSRLSEKIPHGDESGSPSFASAQVSSSSEQTQEESKASGKPFRIFLDIPEEGRKQSEVVVPVKIENNPGVLSARIQLIWDETAMELLSAQRGEAFPDSLVMTPPAKLFSGCCFLWDGVSIAQQDIKDGEILLLSFRLLKAGKYPLSVRYEREDVIGADLQDLLPEAEDQFIFIQ